MPIKNLSDETINNALSLRNKDRLSAKNIAQELGIPPNDANLLVNIADRGLNANSGREYARLMEVYKKSLSDLPRSFDTGYWIGYLAPYGDGLVAKILDDLENGEFEKDIVENDFKTHIRMCMERAKLDGRFQIYFGEVNTVYIKPENININLIAFLEVYKSILRRKVFKKY